jgi:type I restriction enzyme S subunit
MMFRKLDDFIVKRGGSVDPSRFKNETFELLSIPAFDQGTPEIVEGEKIGSSKKIVEPRDVLLSKIVPHIRRCWIVPERSNKRQIASGEWIQFRGDGFLPEYLRLFLVSNRFHSQFMKTVKGVGGSLLRASPAQVAEIEIPIPPLDDQIRIAHLLGKVEGLIAQRKQHLQQLDDLLKSVFLEMFGDPVKNEKGWDVLPFHKVGQFCSGGTPSKSRDDYWRGVFPWVSPKDMKVSKIVDAEDHISEAVFEETSLKRIAPGHLLIVVRGMILAHSFPVAINAVEIAINQDMKAIKPLSGVNVIYLQNCLISLKRQILKLISTAAHGTRKFDTIAMQKLFVPRPPEHLQIQFTAIAEKIEGIKSRYQHSLTDLETLYGALSQKAFKGELDLSRVPLPADQAQQVSPVPLPEDIVTPTEVLNRIEQFAPPESCSELLARWFNRYLANTSPDASLGSREFLESAWQTLQETRLETEGESPAPTLIDYDTLKDLVFAGLEGGALMQTFDAESNRVSLQKRTTDWGTF